MKTFVVINPQSANSSAGRYWPSIQARLQNALGPFEHSLTNAPGHATELVRTALENGATTIITVGGDGTLNETVNAFFQQGQPTHPEANLGIIPYGTGGDLRRTLGLTKRLDEAIDVLVKGHVRRLDLGQVEYLDLSGRPCQRIFINITSFGIAGLVDKSVNESSKALGGRVSFMLGTIKALATYKNQRIRLCVHDQNQVRIFDDSITVFNVIVANGQYFGGGMWIAPQAQPDDQMFDIIILGDLKKSEVLLHGTRIYRGKHLSRPKIQALRGVRVEAFPESTDTVLIDMDGEQPGKLPITLTVIPKAINIIVPSPSISA